MLEIDTLFCFYWIFYRNKVILGNCPLLMLMNVKAYGVLEKDISFGSEGTVFTNVNSALKKANVNIKGYNFIGGLGGRNISASDIEDIFDDITNGTSNVNFIGIGGDSNG